MALLTLSLLPAFGFLNATVRAESEEGRREQLSRVSRRRGERNLETKVGKKVKLQHAGKHAIGSVTARNCGKL